MDLIKYYVLYRGKNLSAPGIEEEDGETFGGKGQNGRGVDKETPALRLGGVSGTGFRPDCRKTLACLFKIPADTRQGFRKVSFYVFIQGLKRRNVENRKPVLRIDALTESGDGGQKTGKGLAAPCGRQGEDMFPLRNKGPCGLLNCGGFPIGFGKPCVYKRMKWQGSHKEKDTTFPKCITSNPPSFCVLDKPYLIS
jgi:hypothetical protein